MSPPALRLGGRHQAFLYFTSAVLVLSGALWLLFHHFITVQGDFGPTAHPLESWWMRIHGMSAALFLIGFGTVLPGHVRRAWQTRRNRISGTSFFAVLSLLIASGYLLYYLGAEELRRALSIMHWLLGLLFPALIGWHVWRGHASRGPGDTEPVPGMSESLIKSVRDQTR